ncbi:cytochrome P450 [Sphingosinicella sp. BN140058]|uniref:cytochrome P450 n=1 Tax=Sphingosinicella sp. BN140058 TaxID=1892855 RepID=UPI00101041A7|nr:cytochrome P450 [Sphingosinicella sp. BN140058]QAY76233.1 cytochrome P450 [Sphingosinicella sp. BN140058]
MSTPTDAPLRYVPPHPPRPDGPVPVWRGFVGERARNAVFGWSKRAFETSYFERNVLGHRVHIPLDPALVQHVMLDNAANYQKPDLVKKLLHPTIGQGLLSSDGALWRDQRRIVAASFAPAAIDALLPSFARAAEAAMAGWGGTIDMAQIATATTMRVISDALFGGDPRLTSQAAIGHIAAALEGVGGARLQVLLGLPLVPVTAKGRRGKRGQIYLRETLSAVVDDRRRRPGDDFLSHMIAALDARFAPAEAQALAVDNAATFYLAGHETTANALTWTLFLLSEQPDLQQQVAAEAQRALAAGVDDPGLGDRLPLLRRVLEESMRLYPPVPRFDRQAMADDRIGEHPISKGDFVSIWPWLIHRHQRLWEDPDRFDEARWQPDARAAHHRFQYIPFGGGPRVCVGMRFATAEMLSVLAHWLARWRFSPLPGRAVRPSGMVTLRPAGGLPLVLSRR